MMTIQKVAREAKVSVATVSRVLNNDGGVSEELRRRTQAVLKGSGFSRVRASKQPLRIALLIDTPQPVIDSFFSPLLSGIAQYAWDHGVETTLTMGGAGGRRRQTLFQSLRGSRCQAAIALSAHRPDEVREAAEKGIPLFLIANRSEAPETGYLDVDNYQGALQVAEYLLSLGHRRIGFLAGPMQGNVDHQQRLEGFREAFRRAAAVLDPEWIVAHEPTEFAEEAGHRQALRLLERRPAVTAMVATNDGMALGAMQACREKGLQLPRDMSITGFDDSPASRYAFPPLTTIRQPLFKMGFDAAKAVHDFMEKRSAALPRTVLPVELIVRRSCSAPVPPAPLAN